MAKRNCKEFYRKAEFTIQMRNAKKRELDGVCVVDFDNKRLLDFIEGTDIEPIKVRSSIALEDGKVNANIATIGEWGGQLPAAFDGTELCERAAIHEGPYYEHEELVFLWLNGCKNTPLFWKRLREAL